MFLQRYYIIISTTLLLLGTAVSCTNKNSEKKDKPASTSSFDANDTLPGRKVMLVNTDSTPKLVYFYKVDEQGITTNEKVREVHYFPGKKKYIEGDIHNEKRNGHWISYFEDGTINSEAYYVDGVENGDHIVRRPNGQFFYVGHFTNGICDGEWKFYNEDGSLNRTIIADSNQIVCKKCDKCKKLKNKK